ncbi:MAG: MFS transporter [Candidatus Aenigmarchaeota archaeon]|nr:MFS transporter [Candidatus Aenigmarchaeota archaeon]
MNRTVKLLMFSDIFVLTGFGLIMPILAIFIKETLIGGTIFAAGIASTLFIVSKSLVQLPLSRYVDAHKDNVKWLIIGTFLIALVPFIYIFATDVNQIYLAQIFYGLGGGLAYPTWMRVWSTHLDKKHESFEWSLYSTSVGLGTAFAAVIGAAIAEFIGFAYTFLLVGVLSLLGCFILFGLERKKKKLKRVDAYDYHKQRKFVHNKHY